MRVDYTRATISHCTVSKKKKKKKKALVLTSWVPRRRYFMEVPTLIIGAFVATLKRLERASDIENICVSRYDSGLGIYIYLYYIGICFTRGNN